MGRMPALFQVQRTARRLARPPARWHSRWMLDDHARRTSDTYNAASDHYDAEPLGFWARVGQRTVERLGLRSGAAVLDAPCGSGASALVAAARIGPDGHVLAIDLAERLLALGRAKAAAARLANIEFRTGDMRAPGAADASFDAVVCVFGIFFVDDMDAQVRRLWRLLRPGGAIAITTWGSGMFAPGDAAFWTAIAAVPPRPRPWLQPVGRAGQRERRPRPVRTRRRCRTADRCSRRTNSPCAVPRTSGRSRSAQATAAPSRHSIRANSTRSVRRLSLP